VRPRDGGNQSAQPPPPLPRSLPSSEDAFVAFIVPDQVGHLDGYRSIREVVGNKTKLSEVRYWGEKVFKGVTTPALTFVADRKWSGGTEIVELNGSAYRGVLKPGDPWFLSARRELLDSLRPDSFSVRPLLADCGIRTTAAKQQVVRAADARPTDLVALEGKRIGRYWCSPPQIAVRLDHGKVVRSADDRYDAAEYLVRQTAAYPIVAPHRHVRHFRNSVHSLMKPVPPMDLRYVVGLLNSRLMRFAYVAETREAGHARAQTCITCSRCWVMRSRISSSFILAADSSENPWARVQSLETSAMSVLVSHSSHSRPLKTCSADSADAS